MANDPEVQKKARAIVRNSTDFAEILEFEFKKLVGAGISQSNAKDMINRLQHLQRKLASKEFVEFRYDPQKVWDGFEQLRLEICEAAEELKNKVANESGYAEYHKRFARIYGIFLTAVDIVGATASYLASHPQTAQHIMLSVQIGNIFNKISSKIPRISPRNNDDCDA